MQGGVRTQNEFKVHASRPAQPARNFTLKQAWPAAPCSHSPAGRSSMHGSSLIKKEQPAGNCLNAGPMAAGIGPGRPRGQAPVHGRALGRLPDAGTTLQICDQCTGVPQALSHRPCPTQGRRPAMEDCYVALAGPEAILARGGEVILMVLSCVLCMENH